VGPSRPVDAFVLAVAYDVWCCCRRRRYVPVRTQNLMTFTSSVSQSKLTLSHLQPDGLSLQEESVKSCDVEAV